MFNYNSKECTKTIGNMKITSRDPITIDEDKDNEIDIGGDNMFKPAVIKIPGRTLTTCSSEWGGLIITPKDN